MKDEIRISKCSNCGKEFRIDVEDTNNICNLLVKQITLNMCDECFIQYLKEREEAAG